MFNPLKIFKKSDKKEEEEKAESSEEFSDLSDEQEGEKAISRKEESGEGKMDTVRLATEIDKIKAAIESMGEIRKATSEKMGLLSEQIGELRAMILDRDRTIQQLELKAIKASDLVESVQPDKLMSDMQKEDAKFEALKANLEGNEAIMDRIMEELKEMRKKLEFFRGIDEIIKLSEEVKKELIDVKKTEATINTQTDKVGTIYAEMRKKFQDIDLFNDNLQELKANNTQNAEDVQALKTKMENLVDKTEFEKMVNKVQRYIDALRELNKSSALNKDLSQLKSILQSI
jgi:hypothetical protein